VGWQGHLLLHLRSKEKVLQEADMTGGLRALGECVRPDLFPTRPYGRSYDLALLPGLLISLPVIPPQAPWPL
jgi:hypothetical protein